MVEEQLAGRRGVHAHLLERLGLLEPVHAAVEHERQHRLVAAVEAGAVVELGVDDDRVGVRPVGDEGLLAVEHELVTVGLDRRTHPAEGVRAGVGLGDRPGADLLEGHQVARPALALLDGAVGVDGAGGQPDGDADRGGDAHRDLHQLDLGEYGERGVHALAGRRTTDEARDRPVEALGRHRVEPEGGEELPDQVVRRQVAVLELVLVRPDLLVDEGPDGVPDGQLVLGPREHAPRLDGSDPLEHRPRGHRAAGTHRDQRPRGVGALQLVQRGRDQPGAGGPDGVAERDRAAVDVGALERGAGLLRPGEYDGRERLVDLEEVEVVEGEAGALEQPTGRVDRTVEVVVGIRPDQGVVDDPRARESARATRPATGP